MLGVVFVFDGGTDPGRIDVLVEVCKSEKEVNQLGTLSLPGVGQHYDSKVVFVSDNAPQGLVDGANGFSSVPLVWRHVLKKVK